MQNNILKQNCYEVCRLNQEACRLNYRHYFAIEQVEKVPEGRRFYLAYLLACTADKQVVKVLGGRKVHLTYLVVSTNGSCHKISKDKRVSLIYLVFCM